MTTDSINSCIDILNEQQQKLRFVSFCNSDALKLGMQIIEEANNAYTKPVSIRIDIDGVTVFSHFMDGTNLGNDWWMKKKLNGCMKTNDSSFMNFLKITALHKQDDFPWINDEGNFAAVGGCFPIKLLNDELKGFIMVSGLPHWQDHQLIVDALSSFLEVSVPTILSYTPFE